MALIVQKFGGSSVATIARIRSVADIVAKTQNDGHQVVVVVSAMQGETDRLIQLAYQACQQPNAQEYDAMLSTGERISSALLSMLLIDKGYNACSYNAHQVGIRTNAVHRKAQIEQIDTTILQSNLRAGCIPVVAGFQGISPRGFITTLGRGGSDMTAVALAAALNADECQIYTDVEGVYTSDPRVVSSARCLDEISYEEMLELSQLGAKVLQISAVQYANKHRVILRVLSSFKPSKGTLVVPSEIPQTKAVVSGIALDRNQAKLTISGMPYQPEYVTKIVDEMKNAHIEVDMMVQNAPTIDNVMDYSFTVPRDDYNESLSITQQLAEVLKARAVHGNDAIAKLSVVGLGMKSHAGVASKIFHVLGTNGIKIHLITSSEVKISAVIDEDHLEQSARALHSAFGLDVTK